MPLTFLLVVGCSEGLDDNAQESTEETTTTTTSTSGSGLSEPTGLADFSQLNFEADVKFIGPRVNAILSEIYRNLELIHNNSSQDIQTRIDNVIVGSTINDLLFNLTQQFPIVGGGVTAAVTEACTNSAAITTQFFDPDDNNFDEGDSILRDYDNVNCTYDFVNDPTADTLVSVFDGSTVLRPRNIPGTITGNIRYEFRNDIVDDEFTGTDPLPSQYTTPTPNNSGTDAYSGIVTLGNSSAGLFYQITDGLLLVTASDSEGFAGSAEFIFDYASGRAVFLNVNILIEGGTDTFTGPTTLRIDRIEKDPGGGTETMSIIGGSFFSNVSGLETTFKTVMFNGNTINNLTANGTDSPNQGAVLFEANGSAALFRTNTLGGGGIISLEEDYDPNIGITTPFTAPNLFDDSSLEAEASGWDWLVGGFLIPDAGSGL